MKHNKQTLLIVLAIILLIASMFFFWRKALPSKTLQQAQTIADWVHGSGGSLNVMVSYPAEMRMGQKNLITVTYQANSTLEGSLNQGYTLDAMLSGIKTVISPRQRILTPIEKGRQVFVWEMEPFIPGELEATVQMAMGDSNLDGSYAITPQATFVLNMAVNESKGLSPDTALKVGLALLGLSGLLLVSYFFIQKRFVSAKG